MYTLSHFKGYEGPFKIHSDPVNGPVEPKAQGATAGATDGGLLTYRLVAPVPPARIQPGCVHALHQHPDERHRASMRSFALPLA